MKAFALVLTAILLLGAPALAGPQPRQGFVLDPFNPAAYIAYRAGLGAHHAKPKPKPKVTHPKTVPAITPPVETAIVLPLAAPSTPAETPAPSPVVTLTPPAPLATIIPDSTTPVTSPTPSTGMSDTLTLPRIAMGTPAFLPGNPVSPAGRPIVIVPFRPVVISAFRP